MKYYFEVSVIKNFFQNKKNNKKDSPKFKKIKFE